MRTRSLLLTAGAWGFAVVGCGGAAPPVEPALIPASAASASSRSESASNDVDTPGGGIQWDTMERSARIAYMKNIVVPAIEPLFRAYDSEKYRRISCMTCHGDGVIEGTYAMPNPELPSLDFGAGYQDYKVKHAKAIAFMTDEVKPVMAKLLGKPVWTQDRPTGFGCQSCHVVTH